jgi:hypothetical protein
MEQFWTPLILRCLYSVASHRSGLPQLRIWDPLLFLYYVNYMPISVRHDCLLLLYNMIITLYLILFFTFFGTNTIYFILPSCKTSILSTRQLLRDYNSFPYNLWVFASKYYCVVYPAYAFKSRIKELIQCCLPQNWTTPVMHLRPFTFLLLRQLYAYQCPTRLFTPTICRRLHNNIY